MVIRYLLLLAANTGEAIYEQKAKYCHTEAHWPTAKQEIETEADESKQDHDDTSGRIRVEFA